MNARDCIFSLNVHKFYYKMPPILGGSCSSCFQVGNVVFLLQNKNILETWKQSSHEQYYFLNSSLDNNLKVFFTFKSFKALKSKITLRQEK